MFELLNKLNEEVSKLIKENKELKLKLKEREEADTFSLENVIKNDEIIMNNAIATINRVLDTHMNCEVKNKKAVLFLAADNSGSMGTWEKFMGKTFSKWKEAVLRKGYKDVEVRYFTHGTEAQEVLSDKEFHESGQGGGTICSPIFKLINEEIEKYNYEDQVDVHVVYVSDGDNLTSDNARIERHLQRILNKVTKFDYIETNQFNRHSSLTKAMNNRTQENYEYHLIQNKDNMTKHIKKMINQ